MNSGEIWLGYRHSSGCLRHIGTVMSPLLTRQPEKMSAFSCSAFFFFLSTLVSAVRALFPLARERVALPSKGFRGCHWEEAKLAFSPCFENGLLLLDRACKSFLMCWRKCYFSFFANMIPIQNYFSCFSIFAKGTKKSTMTLNLLLSLELDGSGDLVLFPRHFSVWLNEGNFVNWPPTGPWHFLRLSIM